MNTNKSFLELLSLCNSLKLLFQVLSNSKIYIFTIPLSMIIYIPWCLEQCPRVLRQINPKSCNNLSWSSAEVWVQLFSTAHPERFSLSLVNLEKQLTFIIIYRAFYHRCHMINFVYTTQNYGSKLPFIQLKQKKIKNKLFIPDVNKQKSHDLNQVVLQGHS